jgi:MFS family permease
LAYEKSPLPAASQVVQRLPRYLPPVDRQGRRYLRVIGILFIFNLISNMVSPLVPGVLVHTLRLSDGWISIGTALNSLIIFIISLFIARLTRRVGNRGGTAFGGALLAVQAVILALARSPLDYLVAVVVGGIGSGILITAQYNYHLDNVPECNRAAWLSWNLLLGNAALLLGSLAGPYLSGWTGTPLALILFGGLRLVTGFIIYRWG